jgi:hypothetical protein
LKCAVVWLTDREAFVRVSGEPEPEGAEMHCIAQRWDAETVQLRFDGARSEWVRIDEGASAWEKPIVAPQPWARAGLPPKPPDDEKVFFGLIGKLIWFIVIHQLFNR